MFDCKISLKRVIDPYDNQLLVYMIIIYNLTSTAFDIIEICVLENDVFSKSSDCIEPYNLKLIDNAQ